MAKKEKKIREKKVKVETAPKLAPFVDSPFPIYLTHEGKEKSATVLSSGLIKYDEEMYRSPCAAATAMAKDLGFKWNLNAWSALKFNRDGERVPLDAIRGAKSPLAKAVAPKREKKAKGTHSAAAKPNGAAKPKRVRKPRAARKPVITELAETQASAGAA